MKDTISRPSTVGTSTSPLMLAHQSRHLGHAVANPEMVGSGLIDDHVAVPDFRHLIPCLAKSAGGSPEAWETAVWCCHSTTSVACSDFIDYLHNLEENFWVAMEVEGSID